MVELDDAISRKPLKANPAALAIALGQLDADVIAAADHDKSLQKHAERYEVATKYGYAAAQGTNHRNSRRTRGGIIAKLIADATKSSGGSRRAGKSRSDRAGAAKAKPPRSPQPGPRTASTK
jgi:hypothetical protein